MFCGISNAKPASVAADATCGNKPDLSVRKTLNRIITEWPRHHPWIIHAREMDSVVGRVP